MIPMRRFGWWMVAAIAILVGCSTTPTPEVTPRPTTEAIAEAADETAEATLEPTPTIEQPTEAPTPTDVAPRMAAAAPSGQNLLVALTTSGSPRQLALMDRAGAVLPIMDIPEDATRVVPCGDKATSPDGRFFAFYVGGDAGTLYLMDGANSPVQVDDAEYLVCLGNGTFQFTPDSRRFGYIDFLPGVTREEYPDGVLKLFDAASAGEIATLIM